MGGCQEIESRLLIIVFRQGAVVGNDLSYFIFPILVRACVNAFLVNPVLHKLCSGTDGIGILKTCGIQFEILICS